MQAMPMDKRHAEPSLLNDCSFGVLSGVTSSSLKYKRVIQVFKCACGYRVYVGIDHVRQLVIHVMRRFQ